MSNQTRGDNTFALVPTYDQALERAFALYWINRAQDEPTTDWHLSAYINNNRGEQCSSYAKQQPS